MPSAIIIAMLLGVLGMMPTVAAYVGDRTAEKYGALCVLVTNACGVLPIVVRILAETRGLGPAIDIAFNPITWLLILGAAAGGWVIPLVVPGLAGPLREMIWARRIARLEARQRTIEAEWGTLGREESSGS